MRGRGAGWVWWTTWTTSWWVGWPWISNSISWSAVIYGKWGDWGAVSGWSWVSWAVNTGNWGGAASGTSGTVWWNWGSGIVVISYATNWSDWISPLSSWGIVTTVWWQTIHTFTSSGVFNAVSSLSSSSFGSDRFWVASSAFSATISNFINLWNVLSFEYNQAWTKSFWHKFTDSWAALHLMSKQDSITTKGVWTEVNWWKYRSYLYSAWAWTSIIRSTNTTYNDWLWKLVTVTYDWSWNASGLLTYVNWIVVPVTDEGNTTVNSSVLATSWGFQINWRWNSTNSTHTWNLSDVVVWSRALSTDEVKWLYEISLKKYLKSNRNLESTYSTNANTVAYYKLNWNSLDSSGMWYHWTTTWITYTQWVFWQSASFNGTTSNIWVWGHPLSTVNNTVSFWVRTNDLVSVQSIIWEQTAACSATRIVISWGKVRYDYFWCPAAGIIAVSAISSLSVNTWTYITMVRSNLSISIYINWKLDTTGTFSSAYTDINPTYIWDNYNVWSPVWYFNWGLDELIIENSLWTADQVKDYYNKSKYKFFE